MNGDWGFVFFNGGSLATSGIPRIFFLGGGFNKFS